jgi:arylsulfatase A-like enzyme
MNAVPVPEFVEGKSLTPLLQDRSASVNEIAVHQYPRGHAGQPHMGYAARDQRFRYVQWLQMDYYAGETTGPVAFEELYDYDNDPLERVNLANDPAFADEVARLQSLLAQTITR